MKTHIWNKMAINSVGILALLIKFAALVLLFLYLLRRFALFCCWNALWDSLKSTPLLHIHSYVKKLFCEWRYVTTHRVHGFCTHGSLTIQEPIYSDSGDNSLFSKPDKHQHLSMSIFRSFPHMLVAIYYFAFLENSEQKCWNRTHDNDATSNNCQSGKCSYTCCLFSSIWRCSQTSIQRVSLPTNVKHSRPTTRAYYWMLKQKESDSNTGIHRWYETSNTYMNQKRQRCEIMTKGMSEWVIVA